MAWSVRLDKSMTYRGSAERWSNRYHFEGDKPANPTAWDTFVTALATQEKTVYPAQVTIVYAAGYADDTSPAEWSKDYTVSPNTPIAGTFSMVGYQVMAGDQAAWIRFNTGKLNSKNKPIYLRKYFHAGGTTGGTIPGTDDSLSPTYKTALTNLAAALRTTGIGTSNIHIADKDGDVPIGAAAATYVTTRTLKRRGGSAI